MRDFKGIWIPKDIWLNRELSITEKVFLVEIDSLDTYNECFASNSHFSDFFRLSKSRVSKIISDLVKKEYINSEIIRDSNKKIIKRILKINHKTVVPYGRKQLYPMGENSEGINTFILKQNIKEKIKEKNHLQKSANELLPLEVNLNSELKLVQKERQRKKGMVPAEKKKVVPAKTEIISELKLHSEKYVWQFDYEIETEKILEWMNSKKCKWKKWRIGVRNWVTRLKADNKYWQYNFGKNKDQLQTQPSDSRSDNYNNTLKTFFGDDE